jgi:hypothetical protein
MVTTRSTTCLFRCAIFVAIAILSFNGALAYDDGPLDKLFTVKSRLLEGLAERSRYSSNTKPGPSSHLRASLTDQAEKQMPSRAANKTANTRRLRYQENLDIEDDWSTVCPVILSVLENWSSIEPSLLSMLEEALPGLTGLASNIPETMRALLVSICATTEMKMGQVTNSATVSTDASVEINSTPMISLPIQLELRRIIRFLLEYFSLDTDIVNSTPQEGHLQRRLQGILDILENLFDQLMMEVSTKPNILAQ